ncbi:MAG: hypothetical protein ACREPZ_06740 [Rhodanobacteraceae bacterium]
MATPDAASFACVDALAHGGTLTFAQPWQTKLMPTPTCRLGGAVWPCVE